MNAMKSMGHISVKRIMVTTWKKAQFLLIFLESAMMNKLAINTAQVCICMALTLVLPNFFAEFFRVECF